MLILYAHRLQVNYERSPLQKKNFTTTEIKALKELNLDEIILIMLQEKLSVTVVMDTKDLEDTN